MLFSTNHSQILDLRFSYPLNRCYVQEYNLTNIWVFWVNIEKLGEKLKAGLGFYYWNMVRLNVSVRNVLQRGLTGSGDYLKCHLSVYTLINVIFKIEIFNEWKWKWKWKSILWFEFMKMSLHFLNLIRLIWELVFLKRELGWSLFGVETK